MKYFHWHHAIKEGFTFTVIPWSIEVLECWSNGIKAKTSDCELGISYMKLDESGTGSLTSHSPAALHYSVPPLHDLEFRQVLDIDRADEPFPGVDHQQVVDRAFIAPTA